MTEAKGITGEKFNSLTVLRPTDEREDRYTVWECRCDCGNRVRVNTKRLKRGTVRSCGCLKQPMHYYGKAGEDITGRRYGRLTALRRAGHSKDGKTRWLCLCDCGNTKVARTSELKGGHVRSCGCLRRVNKGIDLTGRRFSRLLVLSRTDLRDTKGSVIWHCRCDCGKEKDISEDSLVHGRYVSCGCKRREDMSNIHDQLTFVDHTCVEWLRSRKSRSDNTSGRQGVSITDRGKYKASIGFKKKRFFLGTFASFEEAVRARREAEELVHEGFLRAYQSYNDYAAQHPGWKNTTPFVFEVEKQNGEIRVVRETCIPPVQYTDE